MAKLSGIKKLNKAIHNLTDAAAELRDKLNEKQEWFDSKSDKWQESDKGQEWQDHLNDVENLLDEIDNIEAIEE